MLNEPSSVDALFVILTVSALVARDTPPTRLKMMMDALEMNAGVTSWPSFRDDFMTFRQKACSRPRGGFVQ
jgi:hypothetical protein